MVRMAPSRIKENILRISFSRMYFSMKAKIFLELLYNFKSSTEKNRLSRSLYLFLRLNVLGKQDSQISF